MLKRFGLLSSFALAFSFNLMAVERPYRGEVLEVACETGLEDLKEGDCLVVVKTSDFLALDLTEDGDEFFTVQDDKRGLVRNVILVAPRGFLSGLVTTARLKKGDKVAVAADQILPIHDEEQRKDAIEAVTTRPIGFVVKLKNTATQLPK